MNKIRELRIKKGFKNQKEFAEILHIRPNTYCQYETGKREPDINTLTLIADALNVSMDEISNRTPKKGVRIPVYGRVAAGIPIEAIEDILDYEEISEDMARNGEYFALQIKGHSMKPTICNKDIVIVRHQPNIETGEIAIVLVNGDEATCKKIKKTLEGVMLIPLNPEYETMFYSNNEIENLPVRIIGKVVECRRKFERI